MTAREILVAFWPLLALQVVVAAWTLVDLVKRRKVKALPKWAWAILIIANILGAIAYLIFGRGDE